MDAREVFLEVVERGSFTEAAHHLGISLSYVSRRIRSLERELGVSLLARTTRRLKTTTEGERYYQRLRPLYRGLQELHGEIANRPLHPRGPLHIAAPLSFGLSHIQPLVTSFILKWPEVVLDVSFSDRPVDALDYDVTIRGGQLKDSAFIAQHLTNFKAKVVASPAYLEENGTPNSPSDLSSHYSLLYTGYHSVQAWTLNGVRTHPKIRFKSDNGDALIAAALAGVGIAYQPDFFVDQHIQSGHLISLFEEYETFSGAFWAILPVQKRTTTVAAFVAHLKEGLTRF